ncbi:MAG: phytanoyl-CoA dioxygenase family protein [Planctomycetota bacterium]|nr:phytanoyl-CoA dioxygenase family protein [Planctomycetota bacterium]
MSMLESPPYRVTDEQRRHYREHGYVILRGVLPDAVLAELLDRVDGMIAGRYPAEACVAGPASTEGPNDPGRLINQVMPLEYPARDAVLRAYSLNPVLNSIACQLMQSREAEVFQQQALLKEPGAANPTPWHQDEFYWRITERLGQSGVTAWTPLLPASRANGTMWILPDSHLGPIMPHEPTNGVSKFHVITVPIDEHRLIPLELDPGDYSFHHKNLVHGAYANAGTTRRVGMAQHYRSVGGAGVP